MRFKNAVSFLWRDVSLLCLLLAVLIYALWGSPTPDYPGAIEWSIAFFLFFAVGGVSGFANVLHRWNAPNTSIYQYGLLVGGYMISVPLIVSLFHDYEAVNIIRDLIGCFFLLLPVFFIAFFMKAQERSEYFFIAMIVLAIIFCARVIFPDFNIIKQHTVEPLYLANSPIVMFALFFLPFWGARLFYHHMSLKFLTYMVITLCLSGIMLIAVLQDVQRAPAFVLAFSSGFLLLLSVVKSPKRGILMALLFVSFFWYFFPDITLIIDSVMQKTVQVGVNMRFEEIMAIWDIMRDEPLAILFGYGWGASYASPAVGNLYVTYSHSLLTYMFFKTGIVGLCLTFLYLLCFVKSLWGVAKKDVILANALFWALLIPIFLYASYKSFDFGLLLTLIFVSYYKEEVISQRYEKTINFTD